MLVLKADNKNIAEIQAFFPWKFGTDLQKCKARGKYTLHLPRWKTNPLKYKAHKRQDIK